VSLLIAAYNEQAVIARKLDNACSLDYPAERLQIIVAADGSDDDTPAIVRQYAGRGVELAYHPERRGKMAAINRAISQARGDIVVFSDANNLYERDTLRRLVCPLADPRVGVVSGAKYIRKSQGPLSDSEGLYWKYESFIKKHESRLSSCVGAAGEIMAIRRSLYEAPPGNIINDDFYIAIQSIRKGYRAVYLPEARSFETVSATAEDEMARRARIVAGRYQALWLAPTLLPFRNPLVIWQLVSHKFVRPLVPLAMAGALISNIISVIWPALNLPLNASGRASPLNVIFLTSQLIFYGMAWLGNTIKLKGKLGKLLYLPTFLVNSNLAAVTGLYRFLTKRQTTLWQRVRRAEPD